MVHLIHGLVCREHFVRDGSVFKQFNRLQTTVIHNKLDKRKVESLIRRLSNSVIELSFGFSVKN
jgi:hypothetical protein